MTGDKGFVGSHIRAVLESDKSRPGQEHVEDSRCFTGEVVGLEVRERFRDWYDDLYEVMDTPIDVVVHAGQSQRTRASGTTSISGTATPHSCSHSGSGRRCTAPFRYFLIKRKKVEILNKLGVTQLNAPSPVVQ